MHADIDQSPILFDGSTYKGISNFLRWDIDTHFALDLNNGGALLIRDNAGNSLLGLYPREDYDQVLLQTLDAGGNQLVVGKFQKDYDHGLETDPTLFIHSSTDPDSANDEYLALQHNKTDGLIAVRTGHLQVNLLDTTAGRGMNFAQGVTSLSRISFDTTADQMLFSTTDDVGNQMIFTNLNNALKDHDHAVQTDPTLFIHSDTDPDSANDEWLGLSHDKSNAILQTGSGLIKFKQALESDEGSTPTSPPVTLNNGEIIIWMNTWSAGAQKDLMIAGRNSEGDLMIAKLA